MKHYICLTFSIIALMVLNTACVSNMTMQTAKVLSEGELRIGGAVGLLYDRNALLPQFRGRPDKEKENKENLKFPIINPWFLSRYGLGGGCDIGLNLAPYAVEGNFKFQFYNSGDFYLATGIGSYYGYAPDVSDPLPGIHSFDIILPLYVSVDITADYSIYGAAKYLKRYVYTERDDQITRGLAKRHLVSITLGNMISINEWSSFMLEICINSDLGINYYNAQINAGASTEL